jgi:hypothetical protein
MKASSLRRNHVIEHDGTFVRVCSVQHSGNSRILLVEHTTLGCFKIECSKYDEIKTHNRRRK